MLKNFKVRTYGISYRNHAIYKSYFNYYCQAQLPLSLEMQCLCPHPSAKRCSLAAAEMILKATGAPEHIVGCVMNPTMGATNELMKSPDIAVIIAAGGPGISKSCLQQW